mmetsp:Transcript_32731/g.55971  ORF Transcript_32731/g.55971 Transcript_32731/m.55971 type:complete len:323 (-) Transcript_32731:752-1720(-)
MTSSPVTFQLSRASHTTDRAAADLDPPPRGTVGPRRKSRDPSESASHFPLASRVPARSSSTAAIPLSTRVACTLAALEVVQIHVRPPALCDRLRRVAAEAAADGVVDDPEALAELVHEAEGEAALADRGSDEEDAGNFGRLVVFCQHRGAAEAALGLVALLRELEEIARDGRDGPLEAGAQHGRLGSVQHQLGPLGAVTSACLGGLVAPGVAHDRASQRRRRRLGLGCLPLGHDVEAPFRRLLHPLDAKRRQELRARGEAGRGHLAKPVRGVRRQLDGRVRILDVPRGGRGEHGGALASLGQVEGRVDTALVPADDHEVVAR